MLGRLTRSCLICGREIFADHNLSQRNFEAHVRACPSQQKCRLERAIVKTGVGVLPLPGQLQLPGIEGVVEVV